MMATLTWRRQLILKLVVQEFIEKAVPVASEALVRRYELPVSSATVRNDLAALEELGYLTHLHTSAGRIPTDVGYRFFVEHLMESTPLPTDEQHIIRHQFLNAWENLDQWLHIAATVLAQKARNASVITPLRSYQSCFKHLELISLNDTVVLMVLVLHNSGVKQQLLQLDTITTQDELRAVSTHINEQCQDAAKDAIAQLLLHDAEHIADSTIAFQQHILRLIVRSMQQFEDSKHHEIHSDGLIEMLSQPEFLPSLVKDDDADRAIDRVRQVQELVTSKKALGTLIVQALASDGVQVFIGGEQGHEDMRDYSVVLSRYGIQGTATGVLGIIGPTRMVYARSISTVQFIALVMSEFVGELYGIETVSSMPPPLQ